MSDVAEKVKAIIVDKLGVDESEITNEANFINDLGADSLDVIELVMCLEETFDIDIPDTDSDNIFTVEEATMYIERQVPL